MEGLAQQMAGPSPAPQMGLPTVEEVMALLMQGIDPQELINQGIPPELIMEAVTMLEQQMAAESAQAVPAEQQGLASQSVVGM